MSTDSILSNANFTVICQSLGDRINRRRKRMKLTHRELAASIGRSTQTSIRICAGRSVPCLKDLFGYAKALQTTVAKLLAPID